MRVSVRPATFLLPCLVVLLACGDGGEPAAAKQLLLDFFNFQGTRQERADQVMTADYVQHNPRFLRMDEVTGARGSQAWVEAGATASEMGLRLVALGGIRLRDPIILMAEGDLVTAVYRGNLPMPSGAGQVYEAYAFETFRVRGDRVSEHWDQVRLAPGWMEPGVEPAPPGVPQPEPVAGPAPMPGCGAAPEALASAKTMAQDALAPNAEPGARLTLLADDYVSHSPAVTAVAEAGGLSDREAFIQALDEGVLGTAGGALAPRVADFVTAECDYVTVVWRQLTADPDDAARSYEAFTFDTFRFEGGRLAEHWDSTTRPESIGP